MTLARDAILTATLLACVFLFAHQPTPVKTVQVDFCVIDYHVGAFDKEGKLHTGWAKGYGPCTAQDIYRNI